MCLRILVAVLAVVITGSSTADTEPRSQRYLDPEDVFYREFGGIPLPWRTVPTTIRMNHTPDGPDKGQVIIEFPFLSWDQHEIWRHTKKRGWFIQRGGLYATNKIGETFKAAYIPKALDTSLSVGAEDSLFVVLERPFPFDPGYSK